MNPIFQRLMRNATELTRRGNLQAATAAIRSALRGDAGPDTAEEARPDPGVIDVASRDVAPGPAPTHAEQAPAAKPQPQEAPAPFRGPVPPAGRSVPGSHAGAGASRDYRLYIPPAAGERPLPLVVMLHGCTQDADDFAAGTAMNELARAHGFFVLYPEQSREANPQRCWNWFKHSHQARGRGEPALLAGMTREIMAAHPVDPARVYVAGLSAGGAMAAILGDAYPDLYAAVGVHSGLATGVAKDLPSAFGAMKGGPQKIMARATASGVPTIVFHGDADSTVHPGNGGHVIAASVHKEAQVSVEQGVAAGGRRYTRELHRSAGGAVMAEHWVVHGASHAWSGGSASGSYTDPHGPDASAEMVRFFMAHARDPMH